MYCIHALHTDCMIQSVDIPTAEDIESDLKLNAAMDSKSEFPIRLIWNERFQKVSLLSDYELAF